MKLILVNPFYVINSYMMSSEENYPLGLITIENIFNNNGIDCEIVDLNRVVDIQKYEAEENIYKNSAELIFSKKPDAVGLTSMSNNYVNTIILIDYIKKKMPDVKIFMGGPQASFTAKETLEAFKNIDFIVRGESEKVIIDLVCYFNGKKELSDIPNVVYRNGEEVIENRLTYPLIQSEEINMLSYDKYVESNSIKNIKDLTLAIEGGRGCPYNCIFCSTSAYWSRKFRMKSIEKIVQEMKNINSKYNVTNFSIIHDLFTCNNELLKEFCKNVKGLGFRWACSSRIDVLSTEDIYMMKESGCRLIFFGIETGDQTMQKTINKNLDLSYADKIVKYCREIGVETTVSFILGFPDEEEKSIENTLKTVLRYTILGSERYHLLSLNPEHGSRILQDKNKDMFFDSSMYSYRNDTAIIEIDREIKLIEAYPSLFNHYYYFNSSTFNHYFIESVRNVFSILNRYFKYTLYLDLNRSNKGLIKMFSEFMKWESCPYVTEQEYLRTSDEQIILKFFIDYMRALKDECVLAMFEYENDVMNFTRGGAVRGNSEMINIERMLKRYSYNVAEMMYGVKNNKFNFLKKDFFISIERLNSGDKKKYKVALLDEKSFALADERV